jgi:multicomponent Na+:H+ antiporter subunit B
VEQALPVRRAAQLAVGGLLLALAVAFPPVLGGGAPLQHAPAPGDEVVKLGSLELIGAVAFDVGVFALVLGMVVATIGLIAGTREEEAGRP